jgi:hypothetical protein
MIFDIIGKNFKMEFQTLNGTSYVFEHKEIVNHTSFLLDKEDDNGIIYVFITGGHPYNIFAHYEYSRYSYPYDDGPSKITGLMQTGMGCENIIIRCKVEDVVLENIQIV